MAEEYSWSWETPDYGFGTPQEEAPAFDFGADVDWGLTDTSNWGMLDDSWDMFQPLEEDIDWANFDFEEEYGIPSLYDDPYTQYGDYSFNMDAPSYDWGNVMDEGWGIDQDWSLPGPSLRELLGEEVNYASGLDPNDPMYEYNLGKLGKGVDDYGLKSSMDQYFGDQYGDAWRSPWAIGDDPLAGFNFDAEGNLAPYDYGIGSLFPGAGPGAGPGVGAGPQAPQGPGAAPEGRFPGLRNFFGGIMQPRGPGGAMRPRSPFMGGASFTPPFIKRIGDALGLGGGSGLEDFWKEGYGEGGQGGLMNLIPGLGGGMGGQGGGMGGLMMPLGLGILAAQAAKDDRGVDLTPSVTMDPLGRYTLSGTGPEERKEFGLGEIPTSLDFSAYEDIMGGS